MKSVLNLYTGVGKTAQASLNRHLPFLLDGPKPPTWQTPGRLQYYRAENEVYLPDELKWQLRMPERFAMREETFMYNDKVQDEILKFMGSRIKFDYLDANRDVNLDLKVSEAEHLYNANDNIRALAESGKLQDLHSRCNGLASSVETGYIKVMDQLDRTLQQVSEAEQDIYEDLLDSDVEGLRRLDNGEHEGDVMFDVLSMVEGRSPLENYEIVKRAAEEKGDSDVVNAEKSLKSLLTARAKLMDAKATVQSEILAKVSGDDIGATEQELHEYMETARHYGIAAETAEDDASNDDVYWKQLRSIKEGEMKQLLSDIDACQAVEQERAEIYAEYYVGDDSDDSFRQDLLKHLAGNIVVKEHRIRYQKEQFDRFIASLSYRDLKNKDCTLREFSQAYSQMMKATTESSHNYRCPKIEANYDDFGEQTIRPLNSTIFFYFFSANRSGKTWAQWMLSSVRYPNDRMRRAYMRFFA